MQRPCPDRSYLSVKRWLFQKQLAICATNVCLSGVHVSVLVPHDPQQLAEPRPISYLLPPSSLVALLISRL